MDTGRWCVEIIKRFGRHCGRNLRPDAEETPAFFTTDNAIGFLHAFDHCFCVERTDCTQVYDFCVNALLCERLGGL